MFKHNISIVMNTQRPDRKGLYPVRIRTTIKRKVSYYPTGIMLKKEQLVNGEVVKHPNRVLLNTSLRTRITEIERDLLERSISGEDITKQKQVSNPTFKQFAEKLIKDQTGVLSAGRIEQKEVYLRKFVEFNPTIKLKDVTRDTLVQFENFCRGRSNSENTVHSNTSFLKSVLNAGKKDGFFQASPGAGFNGARYINPMRLTVSMDEIGLLEKFADNKEHNKTLRNVVAWFLLGCYTGLRFGDMKNFQGIKDGKITLQTEKTKSIVSIPATPQIKRACTRLENEVFTNQKCNFYLKEVAVILNIKKRITMHQSRHFFSKMYIELGGRTEILARILGHTSLKHTAIYTKISDVNVDAEMKKLFG